jgi:hypothetical protein
LEAVWAAAVYSGLPGEEQLFNSGRISNEHCEPIFWLKYPSTAEHLQQLKAYGSVEVRERRRPIISLGRIEWRTHGVSGKM